MWKEWVYKIFGEIAAEAPEKGKKYEPFFVMYTTHTFGHFHNTDFRETPQEYVNLCPGVSFCREILKKNRFSPKMFFGSFDEVWGQ